MLKKITTILLLSISLFQTVQAQNIVSSFGIVFGVPIENNDETYTNQKSDIFDFNQNEIDIKNNGVFDEAFVYTDFEKKPLIIRAFSYKMSEKQAHDNFEKITQIIKSKYGDESDFLENNNKKSDSVQAVSFEQNNKSLNLTAFKNNDSLTVNNSWTIHLEIEDFARFRQI